VKIYQAGEAQKVPAGLYARGVNEGQVFQKPKASMNYKHVTHVVQVSSISSTYLYLQLSEMLAARYNHPPQTLKDLRLDSGCGIPGLRADCALVWEPKDHWDECP